jgi:hypothetical protein
MPFAQRLAVGGGSADIVPLLEVSLCFRLRCFCDVVVFFDFQVKHVGVQRARALTKLGNNNNKQVYNIISQHQHHINA